MNPGQIFQACSSLAMLGWIILIGFPFWQRSDRFLMGIVIGILTIVYTWLIVSFFDFGKLGDFGSLEGVMKLFTDSRAVTAGWIHYLAFDLLAGLFIRQNARKWGVPYYLVVPCLLLTFFFGPMGLLCYLLIRWGITKNFFSGNF